MRAYHIKTLYLLPMVRGSAKRLKYLDKSHIAQISARREEVYILAAFPVCIVFVAISSPDGVSCVTDFLVCVTHS